MANSNREMQLKKNCRLFAYVLMQLGKEVPEAIQECRDCDGTEEYDPLVDCVAQLSRTLKELDCDTFETIINNPHSQEARELALWWEMYQLYIPLESDDS